LGSVFLIFNIGDACFQYISNIRIPINFDVIGKMYGVLTGSYEAQRAIPTHPKKNKTI